MLSGHPGVASSLEAGKEIVFHSQPQLPVLTCPNPTSARMSHGLGYVASVWSWSRLQGLVFVKLKLVLEIWFIGSQIFWVCLHPWSRSWASKQYCNNCQCHYDYIPPSASLIDAQHGLHASSSLKGWYLSKGVVDIHLMIVHVWYLITGPTNLCQLVWQACSQVPIPTHDNGTGKGCVSSLRRFELIGQPIGKCISIAEMAIQRIEDDAHEWEIRSSMCRSYIDIS